MKRTIALLLVLASLLSLCGCGGSAPTETKPGEPSPVVTEAPMEAPTESLTTEPALSPEEVLYNSLSDRMKQAVDVGIVALSQLEDLDRIVTVGEASAMLQKAYVHRTGVESKTLSEMMTNPDYANRTADRGWVLPIPGAADLELTQGANYENYTQWVKFLNNRDTSMNVWSQFDDRLGITGIGWHDMEEDDSLFDSQVFARNVFAADEKAYFEAMGEDSVYGPTRPGDYRAVVNYGLIVYDCTNGKRYFTLEMVDGKEYYNHTQELTVTDAVEYALIYYNYPNPMEYPEFVAPEEVGKYNTEIITEELLAKQTTLPEPTCQNLPSDWRGVVMDDMDFVHINHHLDFEVYDYEIQLVKEAGFNYIGLNLDFSYLQDYLLFANRYDSDIKTFKSIVNAEDKGKLSVQRLEELDRVLALCMEKDIHVNLRATGLPNYFASYKQRGLENSQGLDQTLVTMWQAIARRYADIPNTYLSFTIFAGDDETEPKDEMLLPSIDAIRLESPDRCIIAEVCHGGMVSAKYAEKGVALSYRMGKNTSEVFYLGHNYFTRNGQILWWGAQGTAFVDGFSWPYQGTVDAAALLDSGKGETYRTVMETAEAYGVGFTLSEFGVSYPPLEAVAIYPRSRYADEAYHAMIRDITSTVEEMGYGWCFGHWYGPYGVSFCIPAIQTSTYEQVEDYPYYIDQGMMGLFQEINGVK